MKHRILGQSGLQVSLIGLGCNNFGAKRHHSLLDLAFSWLTAKPIVSSVIAGATKPEQLEQNVRAADWALTAEDLTEIDRLTGKISSS